MKYTRKNRKSIVSDIRSKTKRKYSGEDRIKLNLEVQRSEGISSFMRVFIKETLEVI